VSEFLPFIIVGITSGSVYGLAGVGLVLTYRTSGVFNFAHGAVATAAAYLCYELLTRHGMAWPLAVAICVLVPGVLLGVGFELIARRLAAAPPVVSVVATVGLLLVIEGAATVRYGAETLSPKPYLPASTFRLPGVNVGYDQLIVVLVGVTASVALAVALSRTRLGMAMRGVVDDASLMAITGIDATRVRRVAWIIGGCVASLSGVLIAPSVGLDPIRLTYLVVQAFGAAAVGRFRSLPGTFGGGLFIGIAAALGQKYASDYPVLLGLPSSVPFIVLFVMLVVSRPGTLPTFGAIRRRQPERFTALPRSVAAAATVAALVLVGFIPDLVGVHLPLYINAAGFVIVFMSLGLLVNVGGQISLCQAAFVAVGAVAFSRFDVDLGLPWPLSVLLSGLVAAPIGALVALPAIRLKGVYLALATFAFGLLMENLVYRTFLMFGQEAHRDAPRPQLGSGPASDRGYFYIAVAVAVAAGLVLLTVQRTRLGRLLRALADSPVALTTFGGGVNTALVLLFTISAAMAGIAGAVIATGTHAAGPASFGSLNSLLWIAIIAICGRALVSSAVVAAVLLAVIPGYVSSDVQQYETLVFGALAVVAALLTAHPIGIVRRIKEHVAGGPHRPALEHWSTRELRGWRRPARARTAAAIAVRSGPAISPANPPATSPANPPASPPATAVRRRRPRRAPAGVDVRETAELEAVR
jgi:branched-subunit amino acid ABC-type transport system permease component